MRYKEEKRDLFSAGSEYHFVHCISTDFGMGKGIVIEFNKRFDMKNKLKQAYPNYLQTWANGDCIKEGKVFNLITKERYYGKPTLKTMENALIKMKEICLEENITKIAMPKIGCGLDQLNWIDVKQLLFEVFEVFEDTDIEIFVCYI